MPQGQLKIELKSPFLPGSGSGNGASIDTDCTFDAYGFPILLGRRLKGCLRESAARLCEMGLCREEDVSALFGTAEHEGHLLLGNAELEGAAQYRRAIDALKPREQEQKQKQEQAQKQKQRKRFLLDPNAIQRYYSFLSTRTAIDEKTGTAKDHALRTARVLKSGLTFLCPASFAEGERELLSLCARSLRHMGTNRMRGLGEVKVTLTALKEDAPQDARGGAKGKNAALECVLELETPALLDAGHVPGVALRGALAALYMKKTAAPDSGDYAEDDMFRRLFLGGLRFEPAFPTDRAGRRYHLAGKNVVRYKVRLPNQSEYVDLAVSERPDRQTKSVGELYLRWNGNEQDGNEQVMYALEPQFERHMHHAQSGELFEYEALAQGTRLLMRVCGAADDLRQLSALMKGETRLRLGRSRSAQYGAARILPPVIREEDGSVSGTTWVATLQSPVFLEDAGGTPQPTCPALLDALSAAAGAPLTLCRSFSSTMFVGGYNPQWRLNKQPAPALAQGTAIVFQAKESISLPETLWLGSRFEEGYGLVYVQPCEAVLPTFNGVEPNDAAPDPAQEAEAFKAFLASFEADYIRQCLRMYAFDGAVANRNLNRDINSSTCQSLLALIRQSGGIQPFVQALMAVKDPRKRENCLNLFSGGGYKTLDAYDRLDIDKVEPKVAAAFEAILNAAVRPNDVTPAISFESMAEDRKKALFTSFFIFYWTIYLENAVVLGRKEAAKR